MNKNKRKIIIPIFIPHKGCPHDCSFCNQKKIAGEGTDVTADKVSQIVNLQLENLKNVDESKEIAFYGGSFTGLPREQQSQLLTIAYEKKKQGLVNEIRISTRPDYINEEILDFLQDYGVSIIELGVQSTDDDVLNLNNRGHSRKDVFRSVSLIRERDIQLGLQMMVGLYGDTEEKLLKTARDIIDCKPDFVRIYPTIVIQDTLLEKLYLDGVYKPISLNEAVYLCKQLVLEFNKNNIPIIRLGLQATEEISIGKGIVAGPYHPAFREIVETEVYKNIIENKITKNKKLEGMVLNIYCNSKDCSKVSGYNQSNKHYFENKYGFRKIRIYPLSNILAGEVNVEIIAAL
ncbi:elongator complex protein 3 [Alkaliphilus sp. B6464]|uniref:elongator complex protein 3 n=1 Tax=Alkaliphilus sp. B6464 TaxID=2731219 RepID=UPI001BAA457F|nr:radical SAM protein [Alkaliphilus sp. B6464]QUH20861.1 radical SAM protein [Alkaliphilus sp. B6464]